MINNLKKKYTYRRATVTLFVITLLLSLLNFAVTPLILPFAAAFFAALVAFALPKKQGIALVGCDAVFIVALGFLFGGVSIYTAFVITAVGALGGFMYVLKRSKPETVIATCAAFILISLAAIWIYAVAFKDVPNTFGAVVDFYEEMYSDFRAWTVKESQKISSESLVSLTGTEGAVFDIGQYLDMLAMLLPALVAITALIFVGITFKVFGLIVYNYSEDESHIIRWRFMTSNVFCIFYIALAVTSLFASGKDTFTISVANLYAVFNFVYAYIGYNFVTALLAQRTRVAVARIIVIAAVVFASSLAIQILAIGGVIFMFLCNKAAKFTMPPNGKKPDESNNESENDNEKH